MKEFIFPSRIVKTEGNVQNESALLREQNLQIGLNENDVCTIKGRAYVILDFGKELAGGARILTFCVSGEKKVRLRFGESVGETCAVLGEKNAGNDHSARDFSVWLQSYSDMLFGQTGFRFLRIDTLEESTVLKIKSIAAVSETDDRKAIGCFECNDETVNKIWNTAAYTLHLCMQNSYIWDGIKRDRLVWIGDLYPEMRAADCLFGKIPETKNCLRFAMTQTEPEKWIAGIPAYSLWWVIILAEEYDWTKEEIESEFYDYAERVLVHAAQHIKENGQTTYPWNFIDWPSNYQEGEPEEKKQDGEIGMYYLSKKTFENALNLPLGEKVKSLCKKVLKNLNCRKVKVQKYKQIAGLGIWAGDCSFENENVLLKNGAHGLSTFMSYFILSGLSARGRTAEALQIMKEYYGGMLNLGATSFWEDFDMDWLENALPIDEIPDGIRKDVHGEQGKFCYRGYRHSLCHGWSAGVIPFLSEEILGVKIDRNKKNTIIISPALCGLKYVKGKVLTPYGTVEVEHCANEDGTVRTQYVAPQGVVVVSKH